MGSATTAPNAARTAGTTGKAVPKARADAARNRERILAAAREALVVHGADAPMDEVARSAGVGNATLYRHFPDRDALVRGVVLAVTERIAQRAQAVLDEEGDSFEALTRFVHDAIEERVGALCSMVSCRFDSEEPETLQARKRVESLTQQLIERGQRDGQVRTDIAVGDLMVALTQLTRPLPGAGCLEMGRFADRHVQLYLDGLRAPARSELPGQAVTLEDLRQES